MTPTEAALWERLRNHRLDGLQFRRQHPVNQFVVDFYCHQHRLAIEVDGGVHADAEQREKDADRQSILESAGITFLRIPAGYIADDIDGALESIRKFISMRADLPLP